jgi:hypothetical protein
MDVTGKDYAYFANYFKRVQQSELGDGLDEGIGPVKDTESDSDLLASGHVSVYLAVARGKVIGEKDDDNDDESVVTD